MATDKKQATLFAFFVILFIPFFFFFLFKPLGKVRPKVPPKLYATGAVDTVELQGEKVVDSVYHTVPNYKFQTQNGDSIELDSLRGNIYVADFFFASCPGICPKLSHSLERVQSEFIRDQNFKIVSFTVDPGKDSIPQLRDYANAHNAIPGKWYFLRNAPSVTYKLAYDGFFVAAKPDDGTGEEAFVHSEKLILVDERGIIRGYYSGVDSMSVNKLMGDIVLLLRQNEKRYNFKSHKNTPVSLF